jgi:predicted alpha/beta-fold hydrolase
MTDRLAMAPFVPFLGLGNGHAQTIGAVYWPERPAPYKARRIKVTLPDGDQLVIHDDQPESWQPGERIVVLIHGLAGSHQSGYVQRIAQKLSDRGQRVFRVDLRDCGAGVGLSRLPYHSGRSEDLLAVIQQLTIECPGSPVTLVGFSLGGNITLKLLGELRETPCGGLDSAMAVCPPVDLRAGSRELQRFANRIYDRHFVSILWQQIQGRQQRFPDAPAPRISRKPHKLWEIDEHYIAPVCGFASAYDYYERCSSGPLVSHIAIPTLILAAADDPIIPIASFEKLRPSSSVQIHIVERGGHLGFLARRRGNDPDRRWMDWRVVDWVLSQPRRADNRRNSVAVTIPPTKEIASH